MYVTYNILCKVFQFKPEFISNRQLAINLKDSFKIIGTKNIRKYHTLLASPYGKKFPYIFLNSSTDKCPLGQSFRNPLYHSCISASGKLTR